MVGQRNTGRWMALQIILALGMATGAAVADIAGPAKEEPASHDHAAMAGTGATAPVVSLASFVRQVLASNPISRAADLERDVADAEILAAQGGFDPVLRSKTDFKEKGDVTKADRTDTVIEQPIPWLFGPRLYTGYRRNVGTNVDPEEETSDRGESRLGVAVSLLQGVFTDRRRAALEKAELRPELAEATRRLERNNLARAAALRYIDWAEATELLAIQDELCVLADARATFVDARVSEGEAAPIDGAEASLEVARRRGDRLSAQRAFEQATIDAAMLLWNGDGTPRPLDGKPAPIPAPAPLEGARIAAERVDAERLRPEIERARLAVTNAEIDVKLANELWWPSIDAFAETIQPDLASPSVDEYKAGFTVNHALRFRAQDGQLALARIAAQRAWLQQVAARRAVDADIDRALVALERSLERFGAVESETTLAQRLAEAERERLDAGDSSLLLVNLRERAAAEAASRRVSAKAEYLRAVITYRWAIGSIAAWAG